VRIKHGSSFGFFSCGGMVSTTRTVPLLVWKSVSSTSDMSR
jgi:hypothetical protein